MAGLDLYNNLHCSFKYLLLVLSVLFVFPVFWSQSLRFFVFVLSMAPSGSHLISSEGHVFSVLLIRTM